MRRPVTVLSRTLWMTAVLSLLGAGFSPIPLFASEGPAAPASTQGAKLLSVRSVYVDELHGGAAGKRIRDMIIGSIQRTACSRSPKTKRTRTPSCAARPMTWSIPTTGETRKPSTCAALLHGAAGTRVTRVSTPVLLASPIGRALCAASTSMKPVRPCGSC